MANIIVVSFSEKTKAIEALHKIKELDALGAIRLYEHMMIRKKENDQYEILRNNTDQKGWRPLTGMVLGGLLGALISPIGLVVGLFSGTTVGAIIDFIRYDFEDDFVKKINNKMKIGTIAIVAEVGEDSPVFIDNALKPLITEIIRSEADVEFDNYMARQIEELEEKIEAQRKKLKKATTMEKVKINAKIDELKEKRKTKMDELDAKSKSTIQSIKDKTEAKIEKLQVTLNSLEDTVSDTVKQARVNRINRRIKRQKAKLNKLNYQLEEVLD